MTHSEIQEVLNQIELKNGWEIHLREDVEYENKIGDCRSYIQIQFDDFDNDDGTTPYRSYCRKWFLSKHMGKDEIVRTVYLAYVQAVMHEADEKFLYRGRAIHNPHTNPDLLYMVTANEQLSKRPEKTA